MGQTFYPDMFDQTLLFPPSLHDWLPEGHLARFLVDVVSALDLSDIYKSYSLKDGRGQAACALRVETGVHGEQSAQALPLWVDATNGINPGKNYMCP